MGSSLSYDVGSFGIGAGMGVVFGVLAGSVAALAITVTTGNVIGAYEAFAACVGIGALAGGVYGVIDGRRPPSK